MILLIKIINKYFSPGFFPALVNQIFLWFSTSQHGALVTLLLVDTLAARFLLYSYNVHWNVLY